MFLYHLWVELPLNTRHAIALGLGVKQKGGIEVVDNKAVKDGYNIKDIELALEVKNLQEWLKTDEEDFDTLWGMMVNKAEGREPIVPVPNVDTAILTPKNLDALVDKVSVNSPQGETLIVDKEDVKKVSEIVPTTKEKGGRPKGMRKVDGKWVKPPVM